MDSQHSKASMLLGFDEARSAELICLTPREHLIRLRRHAEDWTDVHCHSGKHSGAPLALY